MLDIIDITQIAVNSYNSTRTINKETNTEYYYFVLDQVVYIVILGTNSWQDWLTNIDFIRQRRKKVKVHSGFLKAFRSIKNPLYKELKKFSPQDYSLVIIGHSSGGAVGSLLALFLARKKFNVTLFSYGSPATGNKTFSDVCNKAFTHYRFANSFDPVPRSLLSIFKYYPSGELIPLKWIWRPHYIENYFKYITQSETIIQKFKSNEK